MDDQETLRRSEQYLDGLFGVGAGEKHTRFLAHLQNKSLQNVLHGYHVMEADTTNLSVEDNYLIGMCVLCVVRSYATAGMFAKTLLHLGVKREKILEAVARLSMWIGGVVAAEAATHVQRALGDYEERGVASLEAWFPQSPTPEGSSGRASAPTSPEPRHG
jgi:hypothetical protein